MARELASLPCLDEVEAECQTVIAACEPARLDRFAFVIERLSLHYPERPLTSEERKSALADWRRLMGHIPADILEAAADAYLMSPARFFPTPGQLFALCDNAWKIRQLLAKRAQETLAAIAERQRRA